MAEKQKISTLRRKLVAIGQAQEANGFESPTKHVAIRNILSGISRQKGSLQKGKSPILTDELRKMLSSLPDTLLGLRSKALLLIGFSGGFRRSELIGIQMEDLAFETQGVVILLRKSKTDQDGVGYKKAIPYGNFRETCPVLTLKEWLERSGITHGSVFRSVNKHGKISESALSDKAVATIIKAAAAKVGLNPKELSGHSLRVGFVTQATISGVSEHRIMQQTGHRSVAIVRRYVRDSNLFRDNPAGKIGL